MGELMAESADTGEFAVGAEFGGSAVAVDFDAVELDGLSDARFESEGVGPYSRVDTSPVQI